MSVDLPLFVDINAGVRDFPGRWSVTAFVPVCNLHCAYCYNMRLIGAVPNVTIRDVREKLERLRVFSPDTGVVLSGGEPTAHALLTTMVDELSDAPLMLHTNGVNLPIGVPSRLTGVLLSVKTRADGVRDPHGTLTRAMAHYADVPQRILHCVTSDDQNGVERKRIYDSVLTRAEDNGWRCGEIPCISHEEQNIQDEESTNGRKNNRKR